MSQVIQIGVNATVDPEVKQQIDEMMHEAWLDETKDLACVVCAKSLKGEAHWYLALDTENEKGCASGYACFNAVCVRKALVLIRKVPRLHR